MYICCNVPYSEVQLQSEYRRPTICRALLGPSPRSAHSFLSHTLGHCTHVLVRTIGVITLVSTRVMYPLNLDDRANDPRVSLAAVGSGSSTVLPWTTPVHMICHNDNTGFSMRGRFYTPAVTSQLRVICRGGMHYTG
jgi:hypothetical protein